ncbi:MAG TPA: [protein-PII] uridylyltransferase, partial [Gammaproteobacteria bacterium]|nr:[protein-PII] uridylyltransferase [Gammaproteobacteria bacterium]
KAYNTISVLQDNILEQINLNQEIEAELDQMTLSVKEAGDKSIHRHFDHKMNIAFSHNEKWNLTKVEINVIDKQGLLSNIAYIFHQLGIHLVNARITTMGERVEDIFFISNAKKQPLSAAEERLLKQTLEEKL